MKIVVLDGHTLNPGDLSWGALEALGELTVHDRTAPEAAVARAAGAELVLTNKTVLGRSELEALPALRYVGVLATGYNVVDTQTAKERGVVVTNVPAYSTPSVVQLTFALLFELTHRVGHHSNQVRAGRWAASPDFSFWDGPLLELEGLTLGIVGYGNIGRAVARVGRAFGMRVLVHTRNPLARAPGVKFTDLETVLGKSDVVTLHCPLTSATEGLMNTQRLALLKPTAFLLNAGRGPLVDEEALAEALNAGRLAGAGLDVLSKEPPLAANPLLTARNCVLTPTWVGPPPPPAGG